MSRDVVWRTAAPAAAASGTGLGRGLDRIIADKSRTGGQASVLPLPNREIPFFLVSIATFCEHVYLITHRDSSGHTVMMPPEREYFGGLAAWDPRRETAVTRCG
jgi:hypothetical protein